MALGQQKSKGGTSNALAKQVDADGKIKYDVIARYGHAQDKVCRWFWFEIFFGFQIPPATVELFIH